nr:MAG TPA: hypothetical protein [Caudoviricetes sp.]
MDCILRYKILPSNIFRYSLNNIFILFLLTTPTL